ncbi:hypothetical protein BJ165DRAFT_256574 [Panaeolus papilionaceus]|nr:hypothetical protein BJ165DRAFT_256574 [Panaeolus papilionaceus]
MEDVEDMDTMHNCIWSHDGAPDRHKTLCNYGSHTPFFICIFCVPSGQYDTANQYANWLGMGSRCNGSCPFYPRLVPPCDTATKAAIHLDPTSSMTVPEQIQFHTFPRPMVLGCIWYLPVYRHIHFGAIRAAIPRMALLCIFGLMVIDVFATLGPLFPTAQYMIVKMFLIQTVFYITVSITSLIFIFPESLSHIWLTSLQNDFISSLYVSHLARPRTPNSSR